MRIFFFEYFIHSSIFPINQRILFDLSGTNTFIPKLLKSVEKKQFSTDTSKEETVRVGYHNRRRKFGGFYEGRVEHFSADGRR